MTILKTTALVAALTGAAGVGAAVLPVGHAQSALAVARPDVQVVTFGGGRIGVSVSELESTDSKATGGVRVDSVEPGSPAEKAGLRTGDVIVEFDGERVRSVRQFSRLVSETPLGRTVNAAAMRDGQRVTVSVTPRESDAFRVFDSDGWRVLDELRARRPTPAPTPPAIDSMFFRRSNQLGVSVNTLTDQLGEYFGTKTGVLVTSVQTDSLASKIGVKAGDVITAINGATVEDSAELRRRMDRLEEGEEFTVTVMRDRKPATLKGKIEPTRSRRSTTTTRTIL
jgi:serine protease Do